MKLGVHFYLSEFCVSQTAARYNIPMNPPSYVIENLRQLVVNVLDPLRDYLGRPITVTSGWRPERLNALIGGAGRSQHIEGKAADIRVPGLSVIEVCHACVNAAVPFDQMIFEFGEWTHVSYSTVKRRGEILTATRRGNKSYYETGLPH